MKLYTFAFFAIGSLAVLPAVAQQTDSPPPQQGNMMSGMRDSMMPGGMMGNMMGMHVMRVTVTKLDAKAGLVDVASGTLVLKLHFPPASLTGIKAGDKLSVHLGFSKS